MGTRRRRKIHYWREQLDQRRFLSKINFIDFIEKVHWCQGTNTSRFEKCKEIDRYWSCYTANEESIEQRDWTEIAISIPMRLAARYQWEDIRAERESWQSESTAEVQDDQIDRMVCITGNESTDAILYLTLCIFSDWTSTISMVQIICYLVSDGNHHRQYVHRAYLTCIYTYCDHERFSTN